MDMIEFLFASGIIGLLFTISHDIGKIRGTFTAITDQLAQHDKRIATLEEKEKTHERLAFKTQ